MTLNTNLANTPPAPDAPTTHRRTVIIHDPTPSFYGDWRREEDPQEFIKRLNRLFRALEIKDDAERVKAFDDYLVSRCPAEFWFRKLRSSEDVLTWDSLVKVFNEKWPPIEPAVLTSSDYQQMLLDLKLADADLGKTVTVGGQDVWSHVAWAHRAWLLARVAEIEDSCGLIWTVRKQLPEAVRDQLKGGYEDWHTFIGDVKGIKHTWLTSRNFTRS